MRKPVITIVGRPNVGKSTLFNRILGKREAIVDDFPGVTRDRKYGIADWAGVEFVLIDTGGYFPGVDDVIGQEVLKQVDRSIEEADVVVFVTDGRAGVTALDQEIAQILQRFDRHILLAVNKVDRPEMEREIADFYRLGVTDVLPISAENGRNVGDLLDATVNSLPASLKHPPVFTTPDAGRLHLAIVGKPNVGKSSLVNVLLGEEKHIVTEIAGTTRDAIDSTITYYGEKIVLVDTAGLRRRSKVRKGIEFYSTVRSHEAIRRCHVAAVLIDAIEGLTDQDIRIVREVVRFNKGLLLAVNKWDLVQKNAGTAKAYEKDIREKLSTLSYVPVLFISAMTRRRVFKVIELARQIHRLRQQKVQTSELNRFLQDIVQKYPPPSMDRREVKINYITQVKSGPPVFALFTNHPDSIKANYRQYIENQFRSRFDFTGVPLTFVFKKKS